MCELYFQLYFFYSVNNKEVTQKKTMSATERSATKKSLTILAVIFLISLAAMSYVYMMFPELEEWVKLYLGILGEAH